MKIVRKFSEEQICGDNKILIYGAGRYGELAYRGLQSLGKEVYAFVDRKKAGETFLGIKVISPDELEDFINEVFLVASYNYYWDMVAYLQAMGIEKIYEISSLILLEYNEEVLSEYAKDEKHNPSKYLDVVNFSEKNGIVINHCEIVLTEKCTLRCRDCANLMQYYKQPINFEIKEIIETFDSFLNAIDMVLEVRLLGGEPFIVKNIDIILKELVKRDKVRKITIYTNSTIVPGANVIDALANEKVFVHMSDYGKLSSKKVELSTMFKQNNIKYYMHKYEKWTDLGGVYDRKYTVLQQCELYQNCLMAKCYSFYRGKLYSCPRSAHGETLGFFKNTKSEYVDFNLNLTREEFRTKLRQFMNGIDKLTSCNYCNGSFSDSLEIDAAVQSKVGENCNV